MIYGSICSGIEAASVAWEPLGWRCAFVSEIDLFPCAVLTHRYPDVPNAGDFTKIERGQYADIDLLVGGTPCQDFSVAGKRAGFSGARGSLTVSCVELVRRLMPDWFVWENVPGVLQGDCRRGFFRFLRALADCGYHVGWRVLDAQYVRVDGIGRAVPQRRRRVFVVGHLGDWRAPCAVLFEPESVCGDSPPRREALEGIARDVANCLGVGGSRSGARIGDIGGQDNIVAHALRGEGFDASEDGTGRGVPLTVCMAHVQGGAEVGVGGGTTLSCTHEAPIAFHPRQDPDVSGPVTHPIGAQDKGMAVAIQERACAGENCGPGGKGFRDDGSAYTLEARHHPQSVETNYSVRRLTPRECERLQGFPDDWTLVPFGKRMAADGPRYKALGNSMAVNCMRWIGQRIHAVNDA